MIEVIIPAYNCISTLKRALNSLVVQTNKQFTVLLIDDCSTQDIYSIVDSYRDVLSIQYVRNDVNVGVGMTRQRGIDETQADYIAFLDADDMLLPNAIDDWNKEIEHNKPDAISSPFLYVWMCGSKVTDYFWMCHGKVYKTSFLRYYDIREDERVKYIDDGYLNWQVFDLAQKVSLLTAPTYVQIFTKGSVTDSREFRKAAAEDVAIAKKLAIKQISRFKDNPFDNYEKFYDKVRELVYMSEQDNKKLLKTITYKSIENS